MRIVVTGATGFIGRQLVQLLQSRGDDLILLTRKAPSLSPASLKLRYVVWNPEDERSLIREVDGVDAVVNVAGEPIVGKRWSESQKAKILKSRVNAAQIIARSVKEASSKPKVLINASAIGFYGSRESEILTEDSRAGSDYLAEVCKAWEAHAVRVEDFDVRVVRLRIGIVLAKHGGALRMMLPPFRIGIGGWLGSGNQWMSWIHIKDIVRLILFCLDHESAKGAINAVSPQSVTNKAFSLVLAQVLKRPCLLPVPEFALKLLLGEAAALLLASQRVMPKKAEELGFSFQFPDLRRALEEIVK